MNELLNLIKEFDKKKILVIGDLMLDKYTIGTVSRISPEAPVPVLAVEKEEFKAGGAANVATNLSSLSKAKISLFGFVGDDKEGSSLKRILERRNIGCYFEINGYTIMKERIIGRSSGQQQQMVRIDREQLNKKNFRKLSKKLIKIAYESDRIILSDYGKGTITTTLIDQLKQFREKIILDPKPLNEDYPLIYQEIFLMTPNRKEATEMAHCKDLHEAGKKLMDNFKSNILITAGKEGSILFPLEGEASKINTIPLESFEETGAGDTSIATLALSLKDNSKESIINASRLANYAAGITVRHVGAYCPSKEELLESIKNEITKF